MTNIEPHDQWDDRKAEWLVGKIALVGVTTLSSTNGVVSQLQYFGVIKSVKKGKFITIACEGTCKGQTMTLPPDTSIFAQGANAKYRLRSTGEEVDSPDVVASWTVHQSDKTSEENK